jgi:carbohydrate kinase (thermoresistant glucokinase family)
VRLVYLKGDMALIGQRMRARKHHFMPASLLESQFAVLEEPGADESAVIVSIAMSPRRVVGMIIQRLGLEVPPGGA